MWNELGGYRGGYKLRAAGGYEIKADMVATPPWCVSPVLAPLLHGQSYGVECSQNRTCDQ